MNKLFCVLIGLATFTSPVYAQKIAVEGFMKHTSFKVFEKWRDSGKRKHFFSAKVTSAITIYSEGFGFKGTSETDLGLSILDDNGNGRIVPKAIWTSDKDPSTQFKGHADCDLTSGSTTCVMWFKGYGEFEGKIMELTFNEKDAAETDKDDNPNLYMLEGIVMDEPVVDQ